jgi:hypothetical protein
VAAEVDSVAVVAEDSEAAARPEGGDDEGSRIRDRLIVSLNNLEKKIKRQFHQEGPCQKI